MIKNLVAILGRPNVGKSTLFNRLVGYRSSITDNDPGVTRDRHYGVVEWVDKHFTVIDTGGFISNDSDLFSTEIRKQITIALKEATILLFVVDCKDGLTDTDKEFAKLLRTTLKPIFVVANKADNIKTEWMSNDFYSLGMGDVYPISAMSGFGTGDLLDGIVKHFEPSDKEIIDIPKIAVLGRPNVGKSSFVNALLGEERCIVTPLAGTTRDSLDTVYDKYGMNFILTDTAGIRRKNKVKDKIEFYSIIRSIVALEKSDVSILLIDASIGLEAQDVHLLSLADKHKKGIVILVNKWDLVDKNNSTVNQYKKQIQEKLGRLDYIPILFISTLKKQRIFQAMEEAIKIYENRKRRILTSELNKVMLSVIEQHAPPIVKGKTVKIKYITQLPTFTPVFAFFCNLPQYVQSSYKNYLENQLREKFSLEGVPIKLVFR